MGRDCLVQWDNQDQQGSQALRERQVKQELEVNQETEAREETSDLKAAWDPVVCQAAKVLWVLKEPLDLLETEVCTYTVRIIIFLLLIFSHSPGKQSSIYYF